MPLPTTPRALSLVLAVLGGLAVDTAFPGVGAGPLAYVGLALLVLAAGRLDPRWNALVGWCFGMAFFVPHLVWAGGAVGPVPWVALAALESVAPAAVMAVWTAVMLRATRADGGWRVLVAPLAFAVLWVGAEELRSVAPFGGFPWGRLGFSQVDLPIGALAWLGGVPLVSLVTAAVGALLAVAAAALVRRVDDARRGGTPVEVARLAPAAACAGLALVLALGGLAVPLAGDAQAGEIRVGAVQGNVPDLGLASFDQARQVLDNHVTGTYRLLDQVEPGDLDLVLWPENGSDIDPRTDSAAADLISAAQSAVGAPILVGTLGYPESGGRVNTALLWDQGPVAAYDKRRPAPFAEYIPMRPVARLFSDAVDRVRTDMVGGTAVGVLDVAVDGRARPVRLGVGICFEVAYDAIIRQAVQAGAQVLVIPTNNATFGRTDESTQQLAMSRLRAIEHGRAMVQISTVGVSAVISPTGEVLARTDLFTAHELVADLPLRTGSTPATVIGDALAWTLRLAAGALAAAALVARAAGWGAGSGRPARRRPRAAAEVARG